MTRLRLLLQGDKRWFGKDTTTWTYRNKQNIRELDGITTLNIE